MNAEFSLECGTGDALVSACPACGERAPVPDPSHKAAVAIAKDLKKASKAAKKANKKAERKAARSSRRNHGEESKAAADGSGRRRRKARSAGKKGGAGKRSSHHASHAGTNDTAGMDDPEFAALAAQLAAVGVADDGDDAFLWSSDDEAGSSTSDGAVGGKFFS